MKCRECSCAKKGYFASKPDDYVCTGVKEPFLINDIDVECTEYPEKRSEVVTMNTAEMWIKAQKDGKIYECIDGDIAYSRDYGLVDKYDFSYGWSLDAWKADGARGIDSLLSDEWRVMDCAMTIKEAEERFGIKIIGN